MKRKMKKQKTNLIFTIAEFAKIEKETETHREYWHQEVDTIFNKISYLLKSFNENYMAVLTSHQSRINSQIPEMTN
jgi:hypothetical protein